MTVTQYGHMAVHCRPYHWHYLAPVKLGGADPSGRVPTGSLDITLKRGNGGINVSFRLRRSSVDNSDVRANNSGVNLDQGDFTKRGLT